MSHSKSITVWKVAIYRAIGIGRREGRERTNRARGKKNSFNIQFPRRQSFNKLLVISARGLQARSTSHFPSFSSVRERTDVHACIRAWMRTCVPGGLQYRVWIYNVLLPWYVRQTRDSFAVLTIASSRFCSVIFIKYAVLPCVCKEKEEMR